MVKPLKNFETDKLHPIKIGIILLGIIQFGLISWIVFEITADWQVSSLSSPLMYLVAASLILLTYKKVRKWIVEQTPNSRSLARLIAWYFYATVLTFIIVISTHFLAEFLFNNYGLASSLIWKIKLSLITIWAILYFGQKALRDWREDFGKQNKD